MSGNLNCIFARAVIIEAGERVFLLYTLSRGRRVFLWVFEVRCGPLSQVCVCVCVYVCVYVCVCVCIRIGGREKKERVKKCGSA